MKQSILQNHPNISAPNLAPASPMPAAFTPAANIAPPQQIPPPLPHFAAPGAALAPEEQLDFVGRLSERIGGKQAFKRLLITALLFFTLFFVLAVSKFIYDFHDNKTQAIAHFQIELRGQASAVSQTLDNSIAWMDTALSLEGGPKEIVDFITQSPSIIGAAFIGGDGQILAETPGAGRPLASLDRRSFTAGGVRIDSLINDKGTTTPVITRKVGDNFLAAALSPGTLVGDLDTNRAVMLGSGRIVDSSPEIASQGPQAFYRITSNRLNSFANDTDGIITFAHKHADRKVWLGVARIPNSYLSVIDINRREISPSFKQNLMLFALLFAGAAWLIWMVMKQLLQQIDALRERNNDQAVSRQRYRAAVDGSQGGIWEVDLTRNTAYLSPSLAKIMGLPEEETFLPLPDFLSLFEANRRDQLYNQLRRCHISGQFEIEIAAANLPIFLSCRGRPAIRGEQTKLVIGMGIDMSEMRNAQARLQSAETRLFGALRSMNDSFVIWGPAGRLILWNSKFEDFFQFKPGVLRQNIDRATVMKIASEAIDQVRVMEDGSGTEVHLKDGRWVRYLETQTKDGGQVSIGTEITTIRTREEQLQVNQTALRTTINVLRQSQSRIVELAESYEQEKIRAEEANQSKSEFLANMSHELRTPLNAINGFSDIMKKELFGPLGDARYKEYVGDILFSGQHLLSLINDILDMSKIEAGKMTLNTDSVVMSDIVSQVLRIVRGRADENRLKLVFDEAMTPEIEADPRAVKQILLNLITNAIKFTPEGGVVQISIESKSAGAIVHVSDTGIGISQDDIARLAQPFEQIDSQHSRQHEGTGLGLALSKSLVELHGGNFTIKSKVGEGTTVTFTLPKTPIERIAAPDNKEVRNEISRLAQDIADVLKSNDEAMNSMQDGNTQPVASISPITPVSPATTATPAPIAPPMPTPQKPAA